jgi:hypothetical protein
MPENTSEDINRSTNMPAQVTDVQPPGNKIDTNSAFVSHSDQRAPNHLGDPSVPELAGREDQSHDFGDLRSPALAQRRDKSAKEKYYGFRHVKRGDVYPESVAEGGLSCHPSKEAKEAKEDGKDERDGDGDGDGDDDYNDNENDEGDALSICDLCTTDSTKRSPQPNATTEMKQDRTPCKHTLYKMAQVYPRPPKNHHRHIDKMIQPLRPRVDERREERKHRKAILEDGLKDLD